MTHHPLGSSERFWEELAASERRRDALQKLRAAEQASRHAAPLAPAHVDPVAVSTAAAGAEEDTRAAGGVFDRLVADQERKRRLQQQRESERQAREAGALDGLFQPRVDPVSAATVAAQRALEIEKALPVEHRLLQAARDAEARRASRFAEQERRLAAELAPQPRPVIASDATAARADYVVAPLWQRVDAVCAAARGKREELAVEQLQRNCTFRPEINRVSTATAQALLDAMPLVEVAVATQGDPVAAGATAETRIVDPHDVVARLHHVAVAQRRLAQQELEADAALREAQAAPFRPAVDPRSAQLAMRHALEHGGGSVHERQERLDHLRQERIALLQAAHARADTTRPIKQLPASHLKELAERLYKQREEQAARRAEVASATAREQPFRPAVLPESERLLRAKFDGRGVAPVLQRMEHDLRARDAKRRAATPGPPDTPSRATADVMSPERLQRFLRQQEAHSRRVNERTRLLRERQDAEKLVGCSFRPAVVSGTDGMKGATGVPVDACVRGMDAVRARVARAARLKEEKALRERQAFGGRAASQTPTITIPRPCNLSTAQVARRRDSAGPAVAAAALQARAPAMAHGVLPQPAHQADRDQSPFEAPLGIDVEVMADDGTTTSASTDGLSQNWQRRTVSPAHLERPTTEQLRHPWAGASTRRSMRSDRQRAISARKPSSSSSSSYAQSPSDPSSSSSGSDDDDDDDDDDERIAWWQRPLPDAGLLSPTLLADYSDLLKRPTSAPGASMDSFSAKPSSLAMGRETRALGKPPPAPARHESAPRQSVSERGRGSAKGTSALDAAIRQYLKADHLASR